MDMDYDKTPFPYFAGYFIGHIYFGGSLIVPALWWTINFFNHYFSTAEGRKTVKLVFYSRQPIEGILKMANATYQFQFILLMVVVGYSYHGDMTIHLFIPIPFVLSGLVDILRHREWPLPKGLEAVTGSFLFATQLLAIYYHLSHHRSPVNIRLHQYLVGSLVMGPLAIYLEASHPDVPTYTLLRALVTMTAGTWFCQIGNMLYPVYSDLKDPFIDQSPHQMAHILNLFTFQLLVNFVLILLVGVGVWLWRKRHSQHPYFLVLPMSHDV